MAKRKRSKKRRAAKKSSSRRAVPKLPRSRSKDSSGMWVALILAVVAVVGLVLLYNNAGVSGGAVVQGVTTQPDSGYGMEREVGWDLGTELAEGYDGSETGRYCSSVCGDACAEAVPQGGTDQKRCQNSCSRQCVNTVMQLFFRY